MAHVEQAIKVVLTIRRTATNAATLRTGIVALGAPLTTEILARLGLDFTGVTAQFKYQAVSLGSNRYQLYPRVVVGGDTALDRSAIGLKLNDVRDGIVSILTAHGTAIGATIQGTHFKDYSTF